MAATSASELAFLVGEYVGGARVVTTPVEFAPPAEQICRTRERQHTLLRAGVVAAWCTLGALKGTPAADVAARALVAAEAFVRPVAYLADFAAQAAPNTFRFGSVAATSVVGTPLVGGGIGPAWKEAVEKVRQDDHSMQRALVAAAADPLLSGWLDRVVPLDPEIIPLRFSRAYPTTAPRS